MYQEIIVAGVGLIVTALTGGTALGVKRLLYKADALTEKVGEHGERIAAMEVKIPNGEWRAIKDGVAALQSTLNEHLLDETNVLNTLHSEIRAARGDLSQLSSESQSLAELRRCLETRKRAMKKKAKR